MGAALHGAAGSARAQEVVKVPSAVSRGFALVPRVARLFEVNRVSCPIGSWGTICGGAVMTSGIDGGFWPAGTPNNYTFASGLSIAGLIGADGGAWAGDTSGAMFYDPKGTTEHGETVELIHASFSTSAPWPYQPAGPDSALWPDAARVPSAGPESELFAPHLRGRLAASDADAWFASWDGNPQLNRGRQHPLGLLVETRLMGWRGPQWNQDIVYVVFTIHNVTASEPAVYAAARSEIRPLLVEYGARFQADNEQAYGVQLPDGGYTLERLHTGMFEDADIGNAGGNYSSVALPLAAALSWQASFAPLSWWQLPPEIHSAPFFAGAGLTGIATLDAPGGGSVIDRFSGTLNSQTGFRDPQDVAALFRYFSGGLIPGVDQTCNQPEPHAGRVCFLQTNPADTRFFFSSPAVDLAPGGSVTFVVAYPFAAPVRVGSYATGTLVAPGNPWELGDVSLMLDGVNLIDSVAGYRGFTDRNGDGLAQAGELDLVPGSYYGKVRLAQVMFANGFVSPERPEEPDFFLIPGDDQVTVMWRPSPSEQAGDRFFAVARNPLLDDGSPNPLYDPNYREFDVEGYRIYRGRIDDPAALELIATFDYAGTSMTDHAGQVEPSYGCAPELGIATTCPIEYDPVEPGVPRTSGVEHPLVGAIVQVRLGERTSLDGDLVVTLKADTVGTAPLYLDDSGVPFAYVDGDVRNSFRYFYAVTTFDVNSWQSGPSSQESPLVLKSVVPRPPASNVANSAAVSIGVAGDGGPLTDEVMPAIHPQAGTFSKRFPPSRDAWSIHLPNLVASVLRGSVGFGVRLDSLELGSAATDAGGTSPVVYHVTVTTAGESMRLSIPLLQSYTTGISFGSRRFPAVPVDPELAARFGGGAGYALPAELALWLPGAYYTNEHGRGCLNHAAGFRVDFDQGEGECDYNGSRWFSGENETMAHPTAGNLATSSFPQKADAFNNAGEAEGALTIYEGRSYYTLPYWWRLPESQLGGAVRASDIRFTWGEGGTMASARDLTYDVDVPFDTAGGGGWGFLSFDAQNVAELGDRYPEHVSMMDVWCTPQLATGAAQTNVLDVCPETINLSSTAVPGPVAYLAGGTEGLGGSLPVFGLGPNDYINLHPAASAGIVLYVAGHIYTIELEGGQLPPAGTVWTMRSYSGGVINGGQGEAGNEGPYSYVQQQPMPFTAVGAELRYDIQVSNEAAPVASDDLRRVHTVPDPFYISSGFEASVGDRVVQFVNLPQQAIIRIYSLSGVLVDILEHNSLQQRDAIEWDLRNRDGTPVAPGVYFYHVESGSALAIGKFTVVTHEP